MLKVESLSRDNTVTPLSESPSNLQHARPTASQATGRHSARDVLAIGLRVVVFLGTGLSCFGIFLLFCPKFRFWLFLKKWPAERGDEQKSREPAPGATATVRNPPTQEEGGEPVTHEVLAAAKLADNGIDAYGYALESVNLGTGQGTNGCLFAVGHYFSQGSTATKRPPASVCNALRRDVAKTARGELLLVLQRDLKKTWSFCFGKNKILTSFTECITIGEQSGNEIFVTLDRLQEQVSKLRTAMLSTQSTLETSPNAINFKKHQLKQAKEAWDVGALNPNYTQQEKDENTHKTIEKELQILLERQEDAQQRIGDEVSAYNVAKDELEQFRQTNPLLQALCNFVATAGKYRLPDDDLLPSEGATLMVPLADWMTENLLGSLANSNLRTVQLAYLLLYTFCKTERSGQMATDLDVLFLTLHYKRNATLLIERNLGQNVRFSYADWQVKPLQDNLLLHKNDMLLVLWGDHYQAVTVHPKPPRQTGDQQAQTGKKISANIQWPDYDDEEEDEASEED